MSKRYLHDHRYKVAAQTHKEQLLFLCPGANYLLLTFSAPTIYLLQSPNLNSEAEVPKSFLSRKTINRGMQQATGISFFHQSAAFRFQQAKNGAAEKTCRHAMI